MHSVGVLVLCLRVIDCDMIDRLDLPELTSIQMGFDSFMFKDDVSATLIMRSDFHRVN
mgnify:CR=1 FL=1